MLEIGRRTFSLTAEDADLYALAKLPSFDDQGGLFARKWLFVKDWKLDEQGSLVRATITVPDFPGYAELRFYVNHLMRPIIQMDYILEINIRDTLAVTPQWTHWKINLYEGLPERE